MIFLWMKMSNVEAIANLSAHSTHTGGFCRAQLEAELEKWLQTCTCESQEKRLEFLLLYSSFQSFLWENASCVETLAVLAAPPSAACVLKWQLVSSACESRCRFSKYHCPRFHVFMHVPYSVISDCHCALVSVWVFMSVLLLHIQYYIIIA